MEYRVPQAFEQIGDQWIGKLPCVWERYFLEPTYVSDRRHPFRIRYPVTFESGVTFTPPAGYHVPERPVERETSSTFVTQRLKIKPNGDGFIAANRIVRAAGRFPPDRYTAYEIDLNQALRPLRSTLRLTPQP